MIVGVYRPLLRQNFKRPARRWPLWWSESTKTPIFVVFLLTRRKVDYMKLKNGLYCQKKTRKTCLFSPPNTVWPAEGAKRPFSPIFVDFDKQAQKLHQNKPRSASNTEFTSNKGISGVIPDIFFIYLHRPKSSQFTAPPKQKAHRAHANRRVRRAMS